MIAKTHIFNQSNNVSLRELCLFFPNHQPEFHYFEMTYTVPSTHSACVPRRPAAS